MALVQYFADPLTAADDTFLADYVPGDGGSWDKVSGGGVADWKFGSNEIYPWGDDGATHLRSPAPTNADQRYIWKLKVITDGFIVTWFRRDNTALTGYRLGYFNGTWYLVRFVAGSGVGVGAGSFAGGHAAGTHICQLDITGGANPLLTLTVGGIEIFSVTDTGGISDPGRFGVGAYVSGGASGGYHIEEVEGWEDDGGVVVEDLFDITDENVFRSPGCWDEADDSTSIQATNIGAYIIVAFTGSDQLKIDVDVSNLMTEGVSAGVYPKWGCLLRTGTNYKLVTGQLASGQTAITIATGLDTAETYEAKLYIRAWMPEEQVWLGGYDVPYAFRLGPSIRLSDGGTLTAPALFSRRVLQFGDSTSTPYGNLGSGTPMIGDTEAAGSWVALACEALEEEVGTLGIGASSWANGNQFDVPAPLDYIGFYTDGRPRAFEVIDEVRIMHGRNDMPEIYDTDDAVIVTNIGLWREAVRDLYGADTLITYQIPISGYKRTVITDAVAALILSTGDENVRVMDYGARAEWGMTALEDLISQATAADGVHFNQYGHSRFASIVVAAHSDGETVIVEGSTSRYFSY